MQIHQEHIFLILFLLFFGFFIFFKKYWVMTKVKSLSMGILFSQQKYALEILHRA